MHRVVAVRVMVKVRPLGRVWSRKFALRRDYSKKRGISASVMRFERLQNIHVYKRIILF